MDKDDVMKLKNDITILMSKNAAQAQTIERLSDALKALVDYIRDAADDHDCINWYAVNTDEGAAARALLAEIRGKDA